MTIRSAVLFQPDGKASPLFLAQWRSKTPLVPIQSAAVLVNSQGFAVPTFRSLWRAAFPIRSPLPDLPVANKDGTGTDDFWDVFR